MREKLETLSLAQLKELAKGAGIKGAAVMRKAQLVDLLVQHAEDEEKKHADPGEEKHERITRGKTPAPAKEKHAKEEKREEEPAGKKKPEKKAEKKTDKKPAGKPEKESVKKTDRKPEKKLEKEAEKKPERKPETEPEKKPDKEPERKPETEPERKPETEPERKPETEPERKPETEPERKPETEPERRPDRKPQKGTDRKPQKGTDRKPHAEKVHEAEGTAGKPASNRNGRAPEPVNEKKTETENAAPVQTQQPVNGNRPVTPAAEPQTNQDNGPQGPQASGILEVMQDGFGFIRCENYLPGDDDVYVSPSQIRRFNLKTGDIITGSKRVKTASEKFAALLYVNTVNGVRPAEIIKRRNFEDMTPVFPDSRIHLDVPGASTAMRVVDLISPIGKGQRGMIVSPPKAGKTTLLKQIARVVTDTIPDMHLIILLIDERPEEVTDIKEAIEGPQVEVIYSTFDEMPERHKRVSEMVIERAKRLVEQHRDVMILLDSITRLSRAYNLTITPSGRTLSGGLDPAALYMPKRFFGAARNMREGGSLTILATALIDTGSRMDDVVYEEFKGTGNMELVLDRKLSEKRIFPAVDILKSGTRRDDLLLSREEQDVLDMIHKATSAARPDESVERILDLFAKTRNNAEIIQYARYNRRI